MWKFQKEEEKTRPAPTPLAPPVANPAPVIGSTRQEVRRMENRMPESTRTASAHIGKSVVIKGQLSGSEDLFLDGEVEGTIDLPGNTLTIGPSGRIRANITAGSVVIHGTVAGNVRATDKVELKSTGGLTGDIATKRIAIDDGAFFKGGVDIQRNAPAEPKPAATAPSTAVASTSPKVEQPSLIETK